MGRVGYLGDLLGEVGLGCLGVTIAGGSLTGICCPELWYFCVSVWPGIGLVCAVG